MNTTNYNNEVQFSFVKADKELFSVYQTIYSNTDIELWYDWKTRLTDTIWSDDCYFLLKNGEKIGGAIISDGNIAFPFIILPYCDKPEFFKQLHKKALEITNTGSINTSGMLSEDVSILLSMGYRILRTRKAMIRPTDIFNVALDEYTIKIPDLDDAGDISKVFFESYSGGMDYEVFGTPTLKDCTEDALETIKRYIASESIDQSCIIYD